MTDFILGESETFAFDVRQGSGEARNETYKNTASEHCNR